MTTMSAIEQETVPLLTLGWRLRMAMEHAGLTALEIAGELELSRDTVARWIHDETVPKRIYLKAWAERTNVSYAWLVDEPAPKAVRATREPAGKGLVTDNKKYTERAGGRARKGAKSQSYRYCRQRWLPWQNIPHEPLDHPWPRLLERSAWVASDKERQGGE